jgi:hypothetical protein
MFKKFLARETFVLGVQTKLHDPVFRPQNFNSESAYRLAMFKGLYILESWKLGCACFQDGRARFVDHLGEHLV